jgi:hypothetical protein
METNPSNSKFLKAIDLGDSSSEEELEVNPLSDE